MIYEYYEEIANRSNNFFDCNNFVGCILPNGKIYACKNHNVSNVATFLKMYLFLLDHEYENKDKILNEETNDELGLLVLNHLKRMSHDEVHAFLKLVNNNTFSISDLLVEYFGCHLVTRLKKEILTSEVNHQCFYNYLLHDFKIVTISKLVYDPKSKDYQTVKSNERNEYLYDDIKKIKNEVDEHDISLFHKTR